ncbi:hypothetical protein YC2023_057311 [Brassica napus]
MNSDFLSREADNITLLLSLQSLVDGLFRLHEAILTTPRGITRLMDMLMDREVTVSAVGHENVDSS